MTHTPRQTFSHLPRHVRWLVLAVAALTLLWTAAWLAVPVLVKSQGEQRLSALLGRDVSFGRVTFTPWSLALTIEPLRVGAAAGAANREPQLSVDRLVINADVRSLWHLAPVIDALAIEGPKLRLTRLADGHYDIDDLLARFKPDGQSAADDTPVRFALYNVRLANGSFDFDDRPVQRVHRVRGLQLSLPFLSNLPADVAVTVEPRVAFTLDGAAFDSGAQATPFAQDHASQVELSVANLDLAPWLPYLPEALPLRPSRGVVDSTLQIQFALPPSGTPRVSIKGQATLRDVAIVHGPGAGEPLAAWQQLQVGLTDVQPLLRQVSLGAISLAGAQVELRRAADGQVDLLPAATAGPGSAVAPAKAGSSAAEATATTAPAKGGWQVSIEQIALTGAGVNWRDASTRPVAALRVDQLDATVQKLRWPFAAVAPFKISGRITANPANDATVPARMPPSAAAATFTAQGVASDRLANATLDVRAFDLRLLGPYLARALTPTIDGRASLATTLEWARGEQPRLALSQLTASVQDLRVTEDNASVGNTKATLRRPALSLAGLDVAGGSVDLLTHRAALGSVHVEHPALRARHDREGHWNMLGWVRSSNNAAVASDSAAATPGWHVDIGDAQLTNGEMHLHDEHPAGTADAVHAAAIGIQASLRGLAWPGAALARTQLQLRLVAETAGEQYAAKPAANSGRVEWNGQLATAPLQARGSLRVERAPLHAFQPYFSSGLNLVLLRAEASWRGDLAVAQRSDGLDVSARGDALLGDVHVHERLPSDTPGSTVPGDELLSWQSLALRGAQFTMKPGRKPRLSIADASLTDFYSRLVITEQGHFNLRDVTALPPTPAMATSAPTVAAATSAPASAPAAGGLPIDIAVAATRLADGKVDFSDHFVKPNYGAALTELSGRLGAFDSTNHDMATLELRGRAAGTALLEISGSLNPTAHPLTLDIRAKATDLELAPLSPYSGRYAGYAIERGKLSMDVAYKIDPDGKLDAKNQVVLNQLTFGDKVDSPDATKLPVLLAVALLKDRNGVIDINLPISGSINDPQFSVFGIVLKIIGNLLLKALTAPFALLAGGGSDDLSFVGFEPGTTAFTESGRAVLDKVATALTDRPALKMTVTGASDPLSEREATQKAAFEARVLAEQRREALRAGAAADAPLPTLTAALREAIVRRIYADTKLPDKPRNVIGLARDIPVADMEALLRKATPVTNDAARELALQRGLAVRDALIAKGLPSERLFIAAPKLRTPGEGDAAWSPRVQLALGTH